MLRKECGKRFRLRYRGFVRLTMNTAYSRKNRNNPGQVIHTAKRSRADVTKSLAFVFYNDLRGVRRTSLMLGNATTGGISVNSDDFLADRADH